MIFSRSQNRMQEFEKGFSMCVVHVDSKLICLWCDHSLTNLWEERGGIVADPLICVNHCKAKRQLCLIAQPSRRSVVHPAPVIDSHQRER
jgi:hypothetical protein